MPSTIDTFRTLPKRVQKQIDDAFDFAVNPALEHAPNSESPSAKSANTTADIGGGFMIPDTPPGGGGGFLVEDPQPSGGGGFLVEDPEPSGGSFIIEVDGEVNNKSTKLQPTYIPMSLVPDALQRLDLPPDDEEILAVLQNAASGWSSATNTLRSEVDADEQFVSRDDWRTVCAVLLEHGGGDDDDDDDDIGGKESNAFEESDDDAASDEFQMQDVISEGDDDSSDEYVEGPSTSKSRRRLNTRRTKSSSVSPTPVTLNDARPGKLTARQREACLEAYALFFPEVSDEELPKQKIMIKDIQRVAKLLGEKIKADEMVEMLELFSSSPDKSMNLDDFSRMMVAAKLA
ncbi:hypothetical protein BDQ12DRAFT_674389 [Crucibulum laeve]|uniref:EF-hand domain-containing protein n=1 Tax=Crucibulum laeve TaxID=68775 RepID=A0A5C3MGR5_9AGAR|nr:hypothetical protein BDQ12DRAFT_674389 [Crucibulum laeve]